MSDETFQKDLTNKLSKLCGIIPVGTPWMGFDLKSKPFGVQLYQGQLLDRNTYAVHYSWIQDHKTIISDEEWNAYAESHNGMCPYFSYGDNTNTYRMPKIVNVHPKFTNYDAGNYVEAGLPNIIGTVPQYLKDDYVLTKVTGAFYESNSSALSGQAGNGSYDSLLGFDASRSNSIYGNSDTVQPPAINMLIGEYVFSTIGEITKSTEDIVTSNIEKIEWLESIQETYVKKSDVSSYVVDTYISGTSGYRIYSDGWIEQWGRNTVSGDGTYTVTLLKNMKDTNYNITQWIAFQGSSKTQYDNGVSITQLTTSSFTYNSYAYGNTLIWYACGY